MKLKKRLLPVASMGVLACGGALAQTSSVLLYGTIDTAVYSRQLAGETRVNRLDNGLLDPSRWGIRGTEDLGGGLKASFGLSSHFRPDTGETGRSPADAGTFWTREAYVGLQGSFGRVRLGRMPTPAFVAANRTNAFTTGTGMSPFLMHVFVGSQPMLAYRGASNTIWNNSVTYTTPNIGGLTGDLQYGAKEDSTAGRRLDGSLTYQKGPLLAILSYSRIDDGAYNSPRRPTDPAGAPYVIEKERGFVGGVSYDFNFMRAYAQFASTKLQPLGVAAISLDTFSLSAAVPLGSGRILAGWAKTTREQANVMDRHRTTVTLAYDYSFSKRTGLYTAIIADRATGLSSGTGVAVGLHHKF